MADSPFDFGDDKDERRERSPARPRGARSWAITASAVAAGVMAVVALAVAGIILWGWWREREIERDYWEVEKARFEMMAIGGAEKKAMSEPGASSELSYRCLGDTVSARDTITAMETRFAAKHGKDPEGYRLLFTERHQIHMGVYFDAQAVGEEAGAGVVAARRRDLPKDSAAQSITADLRDAAKKRLRESAWYRSLAAKFE